MGCNDERAASEPAVERTIELPAPPAEVWGELPALFGDDGDLETEPGAPLRADGPAGRRVGVVEQAEPARRLTFWWTSVEGDDAPSYVEIELESCAVGTLLRVRETRFDGALLLHSALHARAYA
jgi:uncharacterized protein YndB with AHSA1/START domain